MYSKFIAMIGQKNYASVLNQIKKDKLKYTAGSVPSVKLGILEHEIMLIDIIKGWGRG